jgi:tetratricopeptide (TPR) repeat protein
LFFLIFSVITGYIMDVTAAVRNPDDYYREARLNFLKFTPASFDKSIEYYNKAIHINPNDYRAYSGLGEVYSYKGLFRFLNKREYEEFYTLAANNINKALKLSPNSYETKRALSLNYLHLRWHTRAKTEAKRLINSYPDSPEAYYVYWSSTGKRTENENIKKALSLNDKYVPAHIELGNSYFYIDRNYRKAAEHYLKSIEIADSPELRNYLGTTFRTQGNFRKAIEQYEKALELDKQFAEAYMNLGITLYYMKEYNKSINNLEKAVSLNRKFPDSYYYLGNTYERIQDNIKAIKNYTEFLNMAINDNRYSTYVAKAKNSLYRLNP